MNSSLSILFFMVMTVAALGALNAYRRSDWQEVVIAVIMVFILWLVVLCSLLPTVFGFGRLR